MGAFTALISRNMYDEAKRYVETILQEGVPLVDADYNDQMDSFYTQLRRIISNSIGDGAHGVAFQIQQNPLNLSNDFLVLGGSNGDDGPEELFVKGFQGQLPATETYLIDGQTAPVSSAVVGNTLTDTAANYVPGALVGKVLVPDVTDPGTFFTITANTQTVITCGALDNLAAGANAGDAYRVKLTTPPIGPVRNDLVYLDIYLDDYGAAKDPDLFHNIDSFAVEAMHRKKLMQRVLVVEGITLPVVLSPGWTDVDGNRHVQIPLALIARPGGNAQILNSMITDLRRKIFSLDEVEDLFVNVTGDTMTGPLVMEADIVMASGQKVTGLCIVDGDALCPEVVAQRHFKRDSHLLGDGDSIPTFAQVNDPSDPGHFNVHDNRYYTRSEIDDRTGSNLLVNGGFDDGLNGWENAIPHPLSGGPQADAAEHVIVSTGLCGSSCSSGSCNCRTMKVCILPGSRICYVCPVRQTVDCLRCGGELLFIQTLCVTRGDECILPYVILDMYSSCQYVGTKRVPLFIPTPDKCGIVATDGFVRLTNKVSVPASVDKVSATLCYEITPVVDLPPIDYPYPYYQPVGPDTFNRKCEIGPEGLQFSVCAAQMRRVSGVEGENSPKTGCNTNDIPIIEHVISGNIVEFQPGADQVATLIEVLQESTDGVPNGNQPLDFPGVQFESAPGKTVDELPLQIVPLKTCECFTNCADHLGYSYGLCPSISVGKAIDSCSLPLVALNRDRTKKIAYWGQDEEAITDADIVLVPAKYKDDPLVGIDGSGGVNPDGSPQPGALAALARSTSAMYGKMAFQIPPSVGCRNIWADFAYLDEMLCLGVDPMSREYTFFDSSCACVMVSHTQEISDLITDSCLDRILPDDGFQAAGYPPLPTGYPEAISFEYCAFPRVDRMESVESANFRFRRETPACARPGQGYFVRVEITAKTMPMTVQWSDTLPAGHTLISGVLSDTLVFSSVGQTITREYAVKVGLLTLSGAITGTAQVIAMPVTQLILLSDLIVMDPDCPTLCFFGFGSQTPNVFGQVFWGGGGRFDPTIPATVGLWIKVVAGQGSAGGKSVREQYLIANETIPISGTSHVFHVGPGGTDGFAVDLPVWIFNKSFEDNPQRAISCHDIEFENTKVSPDPNVTGLYGKVTAVDAILNTITVLFNVPPLVVVDFTTLARATIMVAPDQSMGFYWEASPALTDLLNGDPGAIGHAVIRWNYRFWNSTQNPCPGTLGAGMVSDGNGKDFAYEIPGDIAKDVINPADWIDLWCAPMQQDVVAADVSPGDTVISVCDICLFQPCDIIQIVDQNCAGREGGGPGYVGAVVSVVADNPLENCTDLHDVKGKVTITPPIPATLIGCPSFDGFKISRRANIFKKVDVARHAFSLTTTADANGCPTACVGSEEESVAVDFGLGRFTFSPNVDIQNPMICYRTINGRVIIPNVNGIYFLRGIDKTGCKSPPSKPIRVLGGTGGPNPPFCTVPSLFADCFSGLSGGLPTSGWSVSAPLNLGGATTFDGTSLVQTDDALRTAAKKSLGGPPPVVSFTMQFRVLQSINPNAGYSVYLIGADGKNKVTVFLQTNGSVSIRVGNSDPTPQYLGAWTSLPGIKRQIHMAVDGAGIPTLWIDGTSIPLIPSGTIPASAGNTPNTVVIATGQIITGPPPGPFGTAKYDEIFLDGVVRAPTTAYCCPGQGGSGSADGSAGSPTPPTVLSRLLVNAGSFSTGSGSPVVVPGTAFSFTLFQPTLVAIDIAVYDDYIAQGFHDSQSTGIFSLQDVNTLLQVDDVWQTDVGHFDSGSGTFPVGDKGAGAIKRYMKALNPGTYTWQLNGRVAGPTGITLIFPLSVLVTAIG